MLQLMCLVKDAQCNKNASTAYVASLTTQRKQFLSTANLLTSIREISKASRLFLPHYLLGRPLSLFPSSCPLKMIFPKLLLLFKWPKYFSFQ